MKKLFIKGCSVAAAAIILSSCGNSDNTLGSPTGGPLDAEGFAGSVVSFNPTLTFFANGLVEYYNEEATTLFPQVPSNSPASGTFTYKPKDRQQSGILTITLPDLEGGYKERIEVTDFVTEDGIVQGFTVTFDDEGTFFATVDSGSIAAAGKRESGFPSTGDSSVSEEIASEFTFGEDGNIVGGTTFTRANTSTLYSGFYGGSSITYSPLPIHNVGQEVSFTIAESGNFETAAVDRRGGGGEVYTLSIPFLGSEGGILTYRGVDAKSGGTVLITFDAGNTGILTIRWDDNSFSDYEQQSFL